VRAELVVEVREPRLRRRHLQLAQPDVVQVLGRAHDQVHDRADEREERGERRARDQERVVDAAASVGERPEDQRQIQHAEDQQGDAGSRVEAAVLDREDRQSVHVGARS
jgi:hypothetical protein